jgi:hypothetical protein
VAQFEFKVHRDRILHYVDKFMTFAIYVPASVLASTKA